MAVGNCDFSNGYPFALIRDRANQRGAGSRIICSRTQHQRRPPARLLSAGLRIECQPNKIAGLRYITHQDSLPCGFPQSVSP